MSVHALPEGVLLVSRSCVSSSLPAEFGLFILTSITW